ncbi:hypothetical protein [Streptomyces pactum]|nr:hypothetical protein [Streptomyces pactum]
MTLPARRAYTDLCDEIEPGEEAQIDYGVLGQWVDPCTGKRHRV